jgi:hypothetical protein
MRAAAEQTNDMWQTISESEQSSNGKWEASWEGSAHQEVHSAWTYRYAQSSVRKLMSMGCS